MQGVYHDSLGEQESVGNARYASIWNQKDKEQLPLNWDGTEPRTGSKHRRLLRAGATPASLEVGAIQRVQRWLTELPPPRYPYGLPADTARGAGSSVSSASTVMTGGAIGREGDAHLSNRNRRPSVEFLYRTSEYAFQGRGLSRMTVTEDI